MCRSIILPIFAPQLVAFLHYHFKLDVLITRLFGQYRIFAPQLVEFLHYH